MATSAFEECLVQIYKLGLVKDYCSLQLPYVYLLPFGFEQVEILLHSSIVNSGLFGINNPPYKVQPLLQWNIDVSSDFDPAKFVLFPISNLAYCMLVSNT